MLCAHTLYHTANMLGSINPMNYSNVKPDFIFCRQVAEITENNVKRFCPAAQTSLLSPPITPSQEFLDLEVIVQCFRNCAYTQKVSGFSL